MHLDLASSILFKDDNLALDKDINFIFGKNGTGKSTISNLIKDTKVTDFDVRIFQGFESVLGEDDRLNAVILGEENKSVNKQVNEIDKDILNINSEIEKIKLTISQPEDDKTENLYSEHQNALNEKKKKENEIIKFYTDSARQISKDNKLVNNARSYNRNVFKGEIAKSKYLDKGAIEKFENTLKSEKKFAKEMFFPTLGLDKYLDSVNEILNAKVESKIIIEELQNDSEKLTFAQTGLEIHSEDDNCAFCGNKVSGERLHALKSYFSADEVKGLSERIIKGKELVSQQINMLTDLNIIKNDFYPNFIESVNKLEKDLADLKVKQLTFFQNLEDSLDDKQKHLFEQRDKLDLEIPSSFNDISKEYAALVEKNNDFANNFVENQENAKRELRYHEVFKLVEDFQLGVKNTELESLEKTEESAREAIEKETDKIKKNEDKIVKLREDISKLLQQTKNTRKLAENINKKLKTSVTFELFRKEENEQEFYEVKGTNGEIRTIKELSTGEKNIIAFLYFIEKLNEIDESSEKENRIIVFDDPMNSNDDTMQYLIVDELHLLMKNCQKRNSADKFILLTHNVFFYLNCSLEAKNGRNGKNPFEENNFYRLLSDNKQSQIIKIMNNNQDFKTNYEAMWHELVFLFNEDKTEMMLNPIRRIIETYTIFNGIEGFYKDNKDAKNLFNTNSHYFPDLEADLNGKTREEIRNIMKQCFKSNNAENHFNKHWKNAKNSIK
ncbi:AAA family ATPase [Oceanobacillus oncorhynchi]|nr:AAA family ATPase [Oceanobacillus oncorhynchi]MDM8101721.1 AAA family ATPase [Oceanobacillus oncorhynchi]